VLLEGREVTLLQAMVSATYPFNLTGQPALTIPCGVSAAGLPLALQIVGKPFAEATVLQLGHAYEVHTTWHTMRPPL
jgi:aspartyl-tRNA(Asn)/glutamyl-tRNA(Gln) amidotransferase subunit A